MYGMLHPGVCQFVVTIYDYRVLFSVAGGRKICPGERNVELLELSCGRP